MRLPSLSQLFGRRQTRPAGRDVLQRRFDATSGQRGNATFGSYGPETLAGSAVIARKAHYAVENNPWLNNGVATWVTALVGAGITPTPQHPDSASRPVVQAAFNRYSVEELDAEIISDRERERELGLSFGETKEAASAPA